MKPTTDDPPVARLDPGRFDLLTFDCYGTLVDWEGGIIEAVRRVCTAHGRSRTDTAILAAFGEAEHVVQEERYRTYREVLALTLERMGPSLGCRPAPAECDAFAASVGDWPPFPDTVDALQRLGARYRLGIVSNVDDDLFAGSSERLGTDFDWVVTAQQVRHYKPDTAHFEEMVRRSGIPRERTLHVAQSFFHDIAPASSLGYATVHVNRPSRGSGGGATPPAQARADVEVADMAAVAKMLLGVDGPNRPGLPDGHDGIYTIRGGGLHRDWNGIHYKTGLSAKNVPARELSMNVARIAPGGVAFAHIHVDFELMLYILEGTVRHDFGPDLRHSIVNHAGDFVFIEPDVPHEVVNVSDTEDVVAVVARSDASEWENIVDYDRETGKVIPKREPDRSG